MKSFLKSFFKSFWLLFAIPLVWAFSLGIDALLMSGYIGQGPYLYQILTLAGINIILAVSLNLITGFTGQFSIGHAGFFAIGAYASSAFSVYAMPHLSTLFQPLGSLANGVQIICALIVGGLAAALAGILVGIPSLRLRGDYLAIVTLGFGEIIRVFILNIEAIGGARGFIGIPKLADFFWVFLIVVLCIGVIRNLLHSSYGRAFLSVREDEIAAQAMGIPTTYIKILAFTVSALFAGMAGTLFAHFTMYIHPNSFTFLKSFEIILMIAIGGLGSIEGAILGAFVLTVLPELFREFSEWRMIVYSLALIFIMLYRPQGILGKFSFKGGR